MKTSRTIDMARVRKAISGPGVDTKVHVSYGTVATDAGEDGGPNFADGDAVVVSPLGTVVDVLLEPHGIVVPCRYGHSAGVGFFATPIRPGDQVIVLIPDGDLASGPEILKVIPSVDRQTPVGNDGLPAWQNDRVAITARGVPLQVGVEGKATITVATDGQIDLEIAGGGHVRINPDGTVQLGGPSADHPLVKGDTYRNAEATKDQADQVALTLVQSPLTTWIAPVSGEGTTSFLAAFPQTTVLVAAIGAALVAMGVNLQAFEAQAALFLSSISKTR